MNIFKKLTLAALILGAGAQTINAHPWTTKAIAVATLAGLGLGAGTVKYYGFNTVTNAVLEKCANAKNWFSTKLSNMVYGSYKKQIQSIRNAQTAHLEKTTTQNLENKRQNEQMQMHAQDLLAAKEADRDDAHKRAINLSKHIKSQNETFAEKDRTEAMQRTNLAGMYGRSVQHETEKKAALAEVERLGKVMATKEETIAGLQETLTELQAKLAAVAPLALSDEITSESSVAPTDAEETPVVNQ